VIVAGAVKVLVAIVLGVIVIAVELPLLEQAPEVTTLLKYVVAETEAGS
jgi:hypothetical protein